MKDHHGCAVQACINLMSGKWKVQILCHLSFGPRRFAELRRMLSKISEKVLVDQLRQLGRDGVLHRAASPTQPPCVTYSLSPQGHKLVPLMHDLCAWGSAHFHIKPCLPRRPAKPAHPIPNGQPPATTAFRMDSAE
jgi:DNA-binding HxlR family transcriptional regulator